MAERTQVAATLRYQDSGYRAVVQGLKTAQQGSTTLITVTGASRSMARGVATDLGAALGRSVHRVDLSKIVSKWIGETEKNLHSLFNEADAATAILYFDEADSLFGKRSEVKDAHDRYSDMEMGPLTQALARFGGVIVASIAHPGPQIVTRARVRHVRVKFPPD